MCLVSSHLTWWWNSCIKLPVALVLFVGFWFVCDSWFPSVFCLQHTKTCMKLSGPQFLKKKQNYRYFQGDIVHMQPQRFVQTAGRRNQIDLIQLRLMEQILHQLIGSLSHYLQGFIHPRWCRISSINSMFQKTWNFMALQQKTCRLPSWDMKLFKRSLDQHVVTNKRTNFNIQSPIFGSAKEGI